jgi:hypothetical protein
VPIQNDRSDKADFNNYNGISVLSTLHKMLLNILLSGGSSVLVLTYRSTADWIFCILQILYKKWEYNETVHQLFI